MTRRLSCLLVTGMVFGLTLPSMADDKIRFNRDVRNILADNCFKCHGPDANQRQAELRLDNEKDAVVKRDSGRAIVPGNSGKSLLIKRITSTDADERMPPAESGKKLTAAEIATLQKWIASGAKWEKHWSLIRPTRPAVPKVKLRNSKSAIDKYVASRLKSERLPFSKQADPRTLVRRLSFDLTGLPPKPETVDAFVASPTQAAYLALVQKYISSPHYGERMAMVWLDLVRFADTNGIHGDNHREHALFRDYVINAFNSNMRFDRFTVEQLAGDILPKKTRLTQIASGYNRLNMTTREGGAQAKEYRAKYAADRVRNASVVWLGATLGCAQCHDHKFDPFTQRDFYRFAAFFDDLEEVAVGAQKPSKIMGQKAQLDVAKLDKQIAQAKQRLQKVSPALRAAVAKWESKQTVSVRWSPLGFDKLTSTAGGKLTLNKKTRKILASGTNGPTDRYVLSGTMKDDQVAAVRLEVLPHRSLPRRGPGRAGNGNFVLTGIKIEIDGKSVKPSKIAASHNQKNWIDKFVIDKNPKNGWAILPHVGRANQLLVEFKTQAKVKGKSIKIELIQDHGTHNIGHFRLSVTDKPNAIQRDKSSIPANIRNILAVVAKKRSKRQQTLLLNHYRKIAPEFAAIRRQIAKLTAQRKQLVNSAPTVLISVAMKKPRVTRVLPRGNWLDDSGPIVKPGVPGALGSLSLKSARGNRLHLANWMINKKNPLVARVFVNRLWKIMLGQGIVRSLDDFGSQGTWPSHLDLLDWLAIEFIESGWDVKHIVRLIVTTETYKQSSVSNKVLQARDPYNYLLARQNRFRLDAEMVRDNTLAISGLLVRKIGGKSVKPYQPFGYWAHLNFPKRRYKHDSGDSQYRRGLYSYWCRTFTHPSMLAFDAPSREECTVERPRSNTPLAALALLNDPSYVEAARVFAARLMKQAKGPQARLKLAYRMALSRSPSKAELRLLVRLVQAHEKQYQKDAKAAEQVLSVGLRPIPAKVNKAELAAWTSVARVILNLHETITRN